MRDALYSIRYDWLDVRIGGPDATMRGRWPMLLASVAVVFACFFALGRIGSPGTKQLEVSSTLGAVSGGPAIPAGLRGDSPIAGDVPDGVAARAARARSTAVATPVKTSTSAIVVPARSLTVVSRPAPSADTQTQTPAPVASQPAPTGTSTPTGTSGGSSHAGPSTPGASSQSQSSAGGSFDSSE
jgi:hypothetical protein